MARDYWTSTAKEAVADGRRGRVRDLALHDSGWVERVADREACFWCGVRADIGCRHNTRALAPVDPGQAKGPALAEALRAAQRAGGAR